MLNRFSFSKIHAVESITLPLFASCFLPTDKKFMAMRDALMWYRDASFEMIRRDNGRIARYNLSGFQLYQANHPRRFSFRKDEVTEDICLGSEFGIEDEADGEKIDLYVVFLQDGLIVAEEMHPKGSYVDLRNPSLYKVTGVSF